MTSQCKGDFNKRNNAIINLEWVTLVFGLAQTRRENVEHSVKRREEKRRKDVKTRRPVAQLTQNGILLAFYFTAKDAAKSMNTDIWNILNVCDGKQASDREYEWTPGTGTTWHHNILILILILILHFKNVKFIRHTSRKVSMWKDRGQHWLRFGGLQDNLYGYELRHLEYELKCCECRLPN